MSSNNSPVPRNQRNLSLGSCFPEVRSGEASGCKSPASSINGGCSCNSCPDSDDHDISPASHAGKYNTASRRISPVERSSLWRSVSDIPNSALLQAVPEVSRNDSHVALDMPSWQDSSILPVDGTGDSDLRPIRQVLYHSFPLAAVHSSGAISGKFDVISFFFLYR